MGGTRTSQVSEISILFFCRADVVRMAADSSLRYGKAFRFWLFPEI